MHANLEKVFESWIAQMDYYFMAVGMVPSNQAMLGMSKHKDEVMVESYYKDHGVTKISQSWKDIKGTVKECYIPPGRGVLKMKNYYGLKENNFFLE